MSININGDEIPDISDLEELKNDLENKLDELEGLIETNQSILYDIKKELEQKNLKYESKEFSTSWKDHGRI
jgi:archaellum component FlaC